MVSPTYPSPAPADPSPSGNAAPERQSNPPGQPMLEHRFNDDLLLTRADREWAISQFSEIYHVLDHPALRDVFSHYDRIANRAKLWVQRIGLLAVALATVALLSSAVSPLVSLVLDTPEWVKRLSFYAEIAGLAGATIAVGGVLLAGQKKKWLQARMMAEVLRLWHFQSLIFRGSQIDASCGVADDGHNVFVAARAQSFGEFIYEWDGKLDGKLQELIEIPEAGYRLLHEKPTDYASDSQAVKKIFEAYKLMRFRHQANYADHKLKKTTDKPLRPLAWPAAVLQGRAQAVASFCLIGSLAISLLIVIGHLADWQFTHHAGWAGGIIALMILNVATRAIQDGLAAPEELQRYNDYRGKIRYLLTRFEASHDIREKLQLMGEMERAAMEELIGFLRANSDARFLV